MMGSARARMGASCSRSVAMLLLMELSGAQRMRPARFAEAAHDGVVVGFQKHQLALTCAADAREDRGNALQALAFADIHHQRGARGCWRIARSARRTWESARWADYRPNSSPDLPAP